MLVAETGGDVDEILHWYHYPGGLKQRDKTRAAAAQNSAWRKGYVIPSETMLVERKSALFVESEVCKTAARGIAANLYRAPETLKIGGPMPIYEVRTYQLKLGYDSVPKMYQLMASGLPSKLAASDGPTSSGGDGGDLVFMGHADVGSLNEVQEVWRFQSTAACLDAREKSRGAQEWRAAIAGTAELANTFTSRLMRPASFSLWK